MVTPHTTKSNFSWLFLGPNWWKLTIAFISSVSATSSELLNEVQKQQKDCPSLQDVSVSQAQSWALAPKAKCKPRACKKGLAGKSLSLTSNSAACTCVVFCSVKDVGIAMVDVTGLEKT